MPPENDQPQDNNVQIAPSQERVIDPSVPVEAPKVEGADTYAAFEAAQKAAEAAGEPDLFVKPDEPAKEPAKTEDAPHEQVGKDAERPDAPKKTAQDRIRDLTRRGKDAERVAEAKEMENRELRERLEALERGERPAAQAEEIELQAPNPDDKNEDGTDKYAFGELDTKYIRDLSRHEALQTVREERTREESIRQQQAAAAKAEEAEQLWADRLEAAATKHPDFVEKVFHGAEAGKWPLNKDVGALIKDSDVGAEIAYHLATPANLREAVALDKITDPVERARAFGRLEATMQATPKPTPTKKLPTAEPPVSHARGSNGQFQGTPQSFQDFEAKYQPVLDKVNR